MSGETTITVIGNLTDDPELRFTPSGAAVANFTIASTPRSFNKTTNEWEDGDALFLRCSVWREAAENVAESLHKGARVVAVGQLQVRNYERQDGSKGTSVELLIEAIGPELRWATAKITRATRSGGDARTSSTNAAWGSNPNAAAKPSSSGNPWSTAPAPASGADPFPDDPPF